MKITGILLLTLLVNSCFDFHAEIKLHADGSARVTYDMALDAAMTELMKNGESDGQKFNPIEELKNREEPGVTLVSQSERTDEQGRHHYVAVFDVDHIEKLADDSSPIQFSADGKEVSLVWSFISQENSNSDSKEADEFAKALLAKYEFRWDITMPGKILTHNAASVKGQTATWIYRLSEIGTKTTKLEVRSKSK